MAKAAGERSEKVKELLKPQKQVFKVGQKVSVSRILKWNGKIQEIREKAKDEFVYVMSRNSMLLKIPMEEAQTMLELVDDSTPMTCNMCRGEKTPKTCELCYKKSTRNRTSYLVDKLKSMLPINYTPPSSSGCTVQSMQTIKYRSSGIKETLYDSAINNIPHLTLILPHRSENGTHISCGLYIERQYHYMERDNHVYIIWMAKRSRIPFGVKKILKKLIFKIRHMKERDEKMFKMLENVFIENLGFKIALHTWKDIEKIVNEQRPVCLVDSTDLPLTAWKEFPRDFREGDVVILKRQQTKAHVLQALTSNRFRVLFHEDRSFDTVHEIDIETRLQESLPIPVSQINFAEISTEFITWRIAHRCEGQGTWNPIPKVEISDNITHCLPLSLDWLKQRENSGMFCKEEHVVFLFVEGTEFPSRSSEGRVLCWTEFSFGSYWALSGPDFGPSASEEFKVLLNSIVKEYNEGSSFSKSTMASYLINEFGFSVLDIARIPHEIPKTKKYESCDEEMKRGKFLDAFKTKFRQWVKDGVKVKATY